MLQRRTPLRSKGWQPRPVKTIEYTPRARPAATAARQLPAAASVPKRDYWRSPAYRDMARDKPCMLLIPGVCCGDWSTTVLAHSNRGADGKGGAIKSSDEAAVFACFACHSWLDQGGASAAAKDAAWDAAMGRQVRELRRLAAGAGREAELAREALRRLGQI